MSHGCPWLRKIAFVFTMVAASKGETRRAVLVGSSSELELLGDVLAARMNVVVERLPTFDGAHIQRSLSDSADPGDRALLYLGPIQADPAGLCETASRKRVRLTLIAESAPGGCDALLVILPRSSTVALSKAIAGSHPDAPAAAIIARMKSSDVHLEGSDERKRMGLLGQPATSSTSVPLKVMSIDRGGGLVKLNGGLAMDLATRCIVKRIEPRDAPSLRLEVASTVWSTSEAWVSEGGGINNVGTGDVYELERCPEIR